MVSPTILVAGTWGLDNPETLDVDRPWWHPRSEFGDAARAQGIRLADDDEPFVWSTALDGLRGKNLDWFAGGAALRYFAHAKAPWEPVNVIAHSHGGQVALYAAAQGLQINTLVTVATPVRADMEHVVANARHQIRRWVHIYSPSDVVQIEGEVGDGRFGIYRVFPLADLLIEEPGAGHSDLHAPALWTARGWWATCFERSEAVSDVSSSTVALA